MRHKPTRPAILKYQNCVVWYDTEPEAEYNAEEFGAQLAEMQLFVVPVTTRLLTQQSRALEFELELARREHIPVLPLMQESNLDELFGKKFGDYEHGIRFRMLCSENETK